MIDRQIDGGDDRALFARRHLERVSEVEQYLRGYRRLHAAAAQDDEQLAEGATSVAP